MAPRKQQALGSTPQPLASSSSLALARLVRAGGVIPEQPSDEKVPAFLNKLSKMVDDPSLDPYIHWSQDGESFVVPNSDAFSKEVLPKFFKHQNFNSFVRQLNMYGFNKVMDDRQGSLKPETPTGYLVYKAPNFRRGQADLLGVISRKGKQKATGSTNGPSTSTHPAPPEGAVDTTTILNGIAQLRAQQTILADELKELQNSNQSLWQEALASRKRHKRHQDTTDRILRFLAGVFGPSAARDIALGTGTLSSSSVAHDPAASPEAGHQGGLGEEKEKRQVAIIPRNRGLMIGNGHHVDGRLAPEDLEEIELPYADGENDEIEEISSSRFTHPLQTAKDPSRLSSRPFIPTRNSNSSLQPFSPDDRFTTLSPNVPSVSSPLDPTSVPPPSTGVGMEVSFPKFQRLEHTVVPTAHHPSSIPVKPPSPTVETPPSPSSNQEPLSPFSQWMNAEASTSSFSPRTAQSLLLSSLGSFNLPSASSPSTVPLPTFPAPDSEFPPPVHIAGLVANQPYISPLTTPQDETPVPSPSTLPAIHSPPPLPSVHNLDANGRLSPSILDSLSPSFSGPLTRNYETAEAIAADVDALQDNIDSLVASLGVGFNPDSSSVQADGGGPTTFPPELEDMYSLLNDLTAPEDEAIPPPGQVTDEEFDRLMAANDRSDEHAVRTGHDGLLGVRGQRGRKRPSGELETPLMEEELGLPSSLPVAKKGRA